MTISAVVKAALWPLIVLGSLALLAGGGMFLAHDVWRPLWPGVMAFALSFLVFPVLLIPAAMFAGIMTAFAHSNKTLADVCGFLSLAWIVVVFSLCAAASFYLVEDFATTPLRLAMLLWAVGGTVTPWAFFARKDRDNILFTGLVLMLLVGSLFAGWLHFVEIEMGFGRTFLAVAAVLSVMVLLQALYEKISLK